MRWASNYTIYFYLGIGSRKIELLFSEVQVLCRFSMRKLKGHFRRTPAARVDVIASTKTAAAEGGLDQGALFDSESCVYNMNIHTRNIFVDRK